MQGEELKGVMYVEGFAPPELMFSDTERYADERSDLYSFGVSLLFLLLRSEKYKEVRNKIQNVREAIYGDRRPEFEAARSDKEEFKRFYGTLIAPLCNLKEDYFVSYGFLTYQDLIIPLLNMNAEKRPNIDQCIKHLKAGIIQIKSEVEIAKDIINKKYNNILQNLCNKCQRSEMSNVEINNYEIILLLTELGEILGLSPTISKILVDENNIKEKIKNLGIFSIFKTAITELGKGKDTDRNVRFLDRALKDLGVERADISDPSHGSTSTVNEEFNKIISEKIKAFICNDLIPNSKSRREINQKIENFECHQLEKNKEERSLKYDQAHQLTEDLRSSVRKYFADPNKTDPEKFPKLKQKLLKETTEHIDSAEKSFPHRHEGWNILLDLLKLISSIPLLGAPLLISHHDAEVRTGKARCFSSKTIAGLFGCNAQRTRRAHDCFKQIEEDLESIPPPPKPTSAA